MENTIMRRLTFEFVKEQFDKRGYQLLENKYINSRVKMRYKCLKHYNVIQSITYHDIQGGHGCKYCGLETSSLKKIGKNNPNWNPNLTDNERFIKRNHPENIFWRVQVFKRDKFTCQICGDKTGGNLQAHHLSSYTSDVANRLNIDNGITLCEGCHTDFHKLYGYGNNTLKQFKEYKNRKIRMYG